MSSRHRHPWIRTLVALWTLLWMVLTIPCVMAGPLDSTAPPSGGSESAAEHTAPETPDDSGGLVCLHDCSQSTQGHTLEATPSGSPSPALAGPSFGSPLAAPTPVRIPRDRVSAPPHPRAATYLLNQTFLI
ncbi:hypothetical protein [Thiohalorhabdus sp.]|uniref:hypothetical protein n=1 Tax=Thiohalorhabdus sp. TaxID=3094134 RepID=UPI002FC39691